MKYALGEYSQAELTKLNDANPDNKLDFTDLMIFQWFQDFSSLSNAISTAKDEKRKKGMWSRLIDGDTYYYVNYSAIIEEFPLMDVSSIKSISRRFEKYVSLGIMKKKIYHNGKKGSFTFFNFTDKFFSLKYDDQNPEQKVNPHSTKEVIQDKNVQYKEDLIEDNSVSYKNKEKVIEDKNVQCNSVITDKVVQCFKDNPTTNLKNSTTTLSQVPEHNLVSKNKEEAEYLDSIKKLFGYNPGFSPDPFPELQEKFQKLNISLSFMSDYLEWVFLVLKPNCKNQANFASYFYKSFTQDFYISKFWYTKEQEYKAEVQKEARMIICPVCGRKHDSKDYECPVCGLSKDYLNFPEEIKKEKAEYQLRTQHPDVYEKYNNEVKNLWDEYPLAKRSIDEKVNSEFLHNLKKIEDKYLKIA
ncbi:MAG: hypothetical protein MJ181_01905 [Treponema sp.]|uniref:hypothetical protein n=1 Tax=Treponema sp. TaxID=166 RepID=UPI00298DCC41|nr:hypothetical protein [Treponema sp.]MCQ2596577.1 hypothetical protein [Treponema sp.]MCQ2601608.1 hypothetical protein [Treponema sp.]